MDQASHFCALVLMGLLQSFCQEVTKKICFVVSQYLASMRSLLPQHHWPRIMYFLRGCKSKIKIRWTTALQLWLMLHMKLIISDILGRTVVALII